MKNKLVQKLKSKILPLAVTLVLPISSSADDISYPTLPWSLKKSNWKAEYDYRWEIPSEQIRNLEQVSKRIFSEMSPSSPNWRPDYNEVKYTLTYDDEDSKKYIRDENSNYHEFEVFEIEFIRYWRADNVEIIEKKKAQDSSGQEVEFEEKRKIDNVQYFTSDKKKVIYDWSTRRISDDLSLMRYLLLTPSFHRVMTRRAQDGSWPNSPWQNFNMYNQEKMKETKNYRKEFKNETTTK